jgi:hypothetical protein
MSDPKFNVFLAGWLTDLDAFSPTVGGPTLAPNIPTGPAGFVAFEPDTGTVYRWNADTSARDAISGATSAALDASFSSTQGAILYRGADAWLPLAPGAAGQVLTTGGPDANPTWRTPTGGSGGGGGDGLTGTYYNVTSSRGIGTVTQMSKAFQYSFPS